MRTLSHRFCAGILRKNEAPRKDPPRADLFVCYSSRITMAKGHKLAVFDIDGTIAVKGEIPKSVIEGLKHIQSRGYLTTVSTGRAYRRMRDALADDFETVISPEALISLEHGTKMVHRDGRIVQADYFGNGEVEHIVDFIQANIAMVRYFWYALPDPEAPYEFWVSPDEDIEAVRKCIYLFLRRVERAHAFASDKPCGGEASGLYSYRELKAPVYTKQYRRTLS